MQTVGKGQFGSWQLVLTRASAGSGEDPNKEIQGNKGHKESLGKEDISPIVLCPLSQYRTTSDVFHQLICFPVFTLDILRTCLMKWASQEKKKSGGISSVWILMGFKSEISTELLRNVKTERFLVPEL